MKNVIICGDCGDRLLTKSIISACKNHGGALVLNGGDIYQTSDGAEFLVVCVNSLTEADCSAVLVMGEALCQIPPALSLNGVTAVSESSNTDALKILSRTGVPVVGCSSSVMDTMTLSCISGNYMMISLQRPLSALSGKIIEPCEIIVRCNEGQQLYPALAACCTLLLCGVPYENGYDLTEYPD